MFERFTDTARHVIRLAQSEAGHLDHNYIGTEHILLGLMHGTDELAGRALAGLGFTLDELRDEIRDIIGVVPASSTAYPPFTPRAKKVVELALREALALGHNYIGTEHILLAVVKEGEQTEQNPGVAVRVITANGVSLRHVRQAVMAELSLEAEKQYRVDPDSLAQRLVAES